MHHINGRLVIILVVVLANPWFTPADASALEGWSFEGRGILFYTDDVGEFSATRRLSRDGDPTQPALDNRLTNQGSDVVFEPQLDVARSFINRYGTTTVDVRGQGFIFTDNQRFN